MEAEAGGMGTTGVRTDLGIPDATRHMTRLTRVVRKPRMGEVFYENGRKS
jgi:hypothetical protein